MVIEKKIYLGVVFGMQMFLASNQSLGEDVNLKNFVLLQLRSNLSQMVFANTPGL